MKLLQAYSVHFACAFFAVLGSVALLLSTGWGIGLSPDSAVYIAVARNLLTGNGFRIPSSTGEWIPSMYYPPLFPALLGGIGVFGMDPMQGARWLNVVLFGSNIVLIGLCLHAATRSFFLSVSASFLMSISFPMVLVHSMAWSESLLIFFGMLGIYFFALYVKRSSSWAFAAASVAVGLAFLARYAGISLVATGVGATLLWTKGGWTRRWIHTIAFCSISCIPTVMWIMRNLIVAGTATGRKLSFHPIGLDHLESLLDTISTWLFPASDPPLTPWLGIFLPALLGFIAFIVIKRSPQDKNSGGLRVFPALLGLFILNYGLLLIFSISFLDAQTPLDNRILSPVYVATVLLFLCLLHTLLSTLKLKERRVLPFCAGMILVLLSGSQLMQTASWLKYSYDHGVGYASREWNQSRLLDHVKGLGPEVPIFTNGPDIINLLTGRPAYMVPKRIDPGTALPNNHYVYELARMRRELEEKNGIVVYFHRITWRWYLPLESEMNEKLRLKLILKTEDGAIYH